MPVFYRKALLVIHFKGFTFNLTLYWKPGNAFPVYLRGFLEQQENGQTSIQEARSSVADRPIPVRHSIESSWNVPRRIRSSSITL
jgi:hypothetical protein